MIKKLTLFLILLMAVSLMAQTTYNIRGSNTNYTPEIWQQAICVTEGGPKFAVIGHASTPTADTSAIYAVPDFRSLWIRALPDDSAAATGTDSLACYIVIQVRDDRHVSASMTYNGWKRIDSVLVANADTLYGLWYEATKIPPCSHVRTIVVANAATDRGGTISVPHWLVFKQ